MTTMNGPWRVCGNHSRPGTATSCPAVNAALRPALSALAPRWRRGAGDSSQYFVRFGAVLVGKVACSWHHAEARQSPRSRGPCGRLSLIKAPVCRECLTLPDRTGLQTAGPERRIRRRSGTTAAAAAGRRRKPPAPAGSRACGRKLPPPRYSRGVSPCWMANLTSEGRSPTPSFCIRRQR